jgi:Tfp pilus assembly protein PilX
LEEAQMKRPWWQEPRAWHDSWRGAALGLALLIVLVLLALLGTAALLSRSG